MSNSICPDCGRNTEFILHEDGCPQFGKEVEEFMVAYDAEIATWPQAARDSLDSVNRMQSVLFLKTLKLKKAIDALSAALRDAISTYGPQAEIIVTAERQDAWMAVLKRHGSKP